MPTRYEVLPIPARFSHTELYEAGPIQVGVEYRLLNEEIIAEEFGENSREQFGNEPVTDVADQVEEDGVSIHVFDGGGKREFLRFDCFADFPHYHYIDPDAGHQTVHDYDPVAQGPMHEWALDRLSRRLPEMLAQAGATELAQRIDVGTLEKILPDVTAAVERAQKAGRPMPVAGGAA